MDDGASVTALTICRSILSISGENIDARISANILAAHELRMALFRVHDAERKIRLHGRSLGPLARQTYDSLEGAFRAGDADFIDLMEAQ